jgi:hypothetical protein
LKLAWLGIGNDTGTKEPYRLLGSVINHRCQEATHRLAIIRRIVQLMPPTGQDHHPRRARRIPGQPVVEDLVILRMAG